MTARGKWVRAAVVVILVALVGGRFLAVTTADRLWADALGVQESHAAITRLRMMLLATAFAAAALWCVGNFYLVYRSIGSVRVPRRLGNLEIFEALPRQYLLVAAVAVGLLLAAALSHRADAWWYSRALVGEYAPLGLPDPVLGRDLAYYLFILPWQRTVHSYVTLMAGLVLGVVAVLYAALGAVRWHERRLRVSDLARKHLGGLLAAFALALLWGYRLEPAEYVAGVHNVPLDDVLINIRLPSARLLSALAAVAGFLSLLWMWVPRLTVVVFPWCVLAVVSLFGHYVVPAFSGSVRPPEELLSSEVEIARPILLETAYGAAAVETSPPVASTPKQVTLDQRARELAAGPLWEPFAIRVFLNRAAQGPPHTGFAEAELALYRDRDDVPVPVFLGVRQVDLASLRDAGAALSWENVHGSPYAYATGAVAVHANRISELGHPVFITDLAHADSVASQHTGIDLQHPDVLFGRATNDFAVLPRELPGVQGVRAGGILRRLALAWALQSPKLATSDLVADTSVLLWRRAVTERLEHYAPFVLFDEPYPVIVGRQLYWLASGYVSARAFPVVSPFEWRGRRVRYLRSRMVGVVEAWTGRTSVYLQRDPDPLSAAWARLTPEIVQPVGAMPSALRSHVRYPRGLFDLQLDVLARTRLRDVLTPVPGSGLGQTGSGPEAFWWVGPTPSDTAVRLQRAAAFENGDPPMLVGLVHGAVVDGQPVLTVSRLPPPFDIEGPSLLPRRLALLRGSGVDGVDGRVRTAILEDGVLRLRALYSTHDDDLDAIPRVAEVGIALGNVVARGATLRDALASLETTAGPIHALVPRWGEARLWFRQLDSARQAGDWAAFGRAYEELKRLFGMGVDSTP
jgi:uncharacterized membrane protein (UPF0182 family)